MTMGAKCREELTGLQDGKLDKGWDTTNKSWPAHWQPHE